MASAIIDIAKEILGIKKSGPANRSTNKSILPFSRINDYIMGKDGYLKLVVQVTPLHGDSMEVEDMETAEEAIRVALVSWRGRIQILINSEKVRVEKNIQWLTGKQKEEDHDLFIDMIEEQKNSFREISENIRTVNRFYLILEGKGQGIESDLKNTLATMSNQMVEVGMDVHVLTREEIMRGLYERLNPNTSVHQPYQHGMPEHLLMPAQMKSNMFGVMQIDNRFYQHMAIIHYPTRPNKRFRWLAPLLKVNGNKTISFMLNPRPKGQELTKAVGKMVNRLRQEERNAKREDERIQKEFEYESAKRMYERITSSNETIYDMTVIVEASGDTEEEMKATYSNLSNALSATECYARSILLPGKDRFEAFWACLPILHRSKVADEYYKWNFPARTIASILPFDSGEFQEESGIFFAENPINNAPYVFNRYDAKLHDNPHGFALGLPGAGKSYDMTNEIIREAPLVDHIILFDPEREYFFTFGTRYNVAQICTNPFHVRSPIIDSDNDLMDMKKHYWEATRLHIQNILPLFKFLMPEMTSTEASMVEEDVREMYQEAGFDENMAGFPAVFPTLSDYKAVLSRKIRDSDSEERPGRKRILVTFAPYIDGIYSSLLNGQTSWEFSDRLITFDIHDIAKGVKSSIYYLLLLHTWQFIKECRQQGKTTALKADEVHVMMNKNNEDAAEFLYNVNKRGRKYFCALQLATQNLLDFLGVSYSGGERKESNITQYGTAIINNSRFKKIFRIGKLDLQELGMLYSFTKRERKILSATRGRGKGIMVIGDTQKIEFQTKRFAYEEKYIKKGEYTA